MSAPPVVNAGKLAEGPSREMLSAIIALVRQLEPVAAQCYPGADQNPILRLYITGSVVLQAAAMIVRECNLPMMTREAWAHQALMAWDQAGLAAQPPGPAS